MKKIGNFFSWFWEKAKAAYAWATSQETKEKAAKMVATIKVLALKAHALCVATFKKAQVIAVLTRRYEAKQSIVTAFKAAYAEVSKMDIDGLNKFIAFELTKEEKAAVAQAVPCAA